MTMKRVYIGYASNAQDTEEPTYQIYPCPKPFTPEEDITVIGCQLCLMVKEPAQNDGFLDVQAHLAQDTIATDNLLANKRTLCELSAGGVWNTAPASTDWHEATATVMFPVGYGVSIREGEHLYLDAIAKGATAGIWHWTCVAQIFYVKEKAI